MASSVHLRLLSAAFAALFSVGMAANATAEENMTLITYGKDAPTREGDFNHAQTLYFSIPGDVKGHLWVSVFDPGVSRDYDQLMNLTAESKTRFALFPGHDG